MKIQIFAAADCLCWSYHAQMDAVFVS